MGYVGTAMATLVASTKKKLNYQYFVTGIEQQNKNGKEIAKKINEPSNTFVFVEGEEVGYMDYMNTYVST